MATHEVNMDTETILSIAREALLLSLTVSGPAVLAATLVGLIVGILMTATQVQEQSLATVLKIVTVYMVLAFAGAWMLATLANFASQVLARIGDVRM
jgi:flagellar biosynthesis protein FliQ